MSDELLPQFLIEGRELTGLAAAELEELRRDAGAPERIDALFRAVHTLKGSVALFDLPALGAMLHAGESLMEGLRAGRVADDAVLSALIETIDETERWLDALEAGAALAPQTAMALQARLQSLTDGDSDAAPAPQGGAGLLWAEALAARAPDFEGERIAIRYRPSPDSYLSGDDPIAIVQSAPGLVWLNVGLAGAPDLQAYDPFRCDLVIEGLSTAPPSQLHAAFRFVSDQIELAPVQSVGAPSPAAASPVRSGGSLRVDGARVDALAQLADELIIAKNALSHATFLLTAQSGAGSGPLAMAQANLDRTVGRLHASINEMRLTPLGQLFASLPRQVRTLARDLGKEVDLVTTGEDVQMDKAVVDGLFEPVLHLLRNALDHGIEPAAARRAAGKTTRSQLRLDARAMDGEVVIEVSDDGRGFDPAAIRRTALQRGLVDAADLAAMDEPALFGLIFEPGFSTAAAVTEVSGRGVGMDAVRATVTRLGGRITLSSRPGQGASVRLTLPARVILARLMVVRVGAERFGVALESIVQTVRVGADELTSIRAGRAFVLRGEVVPLVSLAACVGRPEGSDPAALTVLVVRTAVGNIGVVVDALAERLEAPLRPMTGLLAGTPGVRGAVLQGDGAVLMVLDLEELIG